MEVYDAAAWSSVAPLSLASLQSGTARKISRLRADAAVSYWIKISPGENHGIDTDAAGNGLVTDHRLYQLVKQKSAITDHTFVIEFQQPEVQAFSFTFG